MFLLKKCTTPCFTKLLFWRGKQQIDWVISQLVDAAQHVIGKVNATPFPTAAVTSAIKTKHRIDWSASINSTHYRQPLERTEHLLMTFSRGQRHAQSPDRLTDQLEDLTSSQFADRLVIALLMRWNNQHISYINTRLLQ